MPRPSKQLCLLPFLALLTLAACHAGMSKDTWGPSPEPVYSAEEARPDGFTSGPQSPQGTEATTGSWKRSTLPANATRLMIGEKESLPLTAATAHALIDGPRARVLLELDFHNPHGRNLEGTFQLRLPPGASPYYLAFGQTVMASPDRFPEGDGGWLSTEAIRANLGGEGSSIIEARVVQRDKAAHAYREITQVRRTDPALMEWAGAGVFKTRVFPILGNRPHRIIVGYDLDLIHAGDTHSLSLALPKAEKRAAHVAVRDLGGGFEASFEPSPNNTSAIGAGYRRHTWHNEGSARLEVKLSGVPSEPILRDNHAGVGDLFTARFTPALPKQAVDGKGGPALFLVDTSWSSHPERFAIWLDLMKAILDNNRGDMDAFAVLFFDVTGHWWKPAFTPNTPQEVEALMAHANSLSLEGATNIEGALAQASRPSWYKGELKSWRTFLLSDGGASWGNIDPKAMKTPGPLFAYQTGLEGTSTRVLNTLTRQSGGALFSVPGEDAVAKASRAHLSLPWVLEGVSVEGGQDLVLEGRPRVLYPGQKLLIAGRGAPEAGSKVSLSLSNASGETRTVEHTLGSVIDSALASRHYGQVVVGHLEGLQAVYKGKATAFARHFRVPGRNVSLLMMETEQDYARFDIKPEDDLHEVKATTISGFVDLDETFSAKQAFIDQMVRLSEAPGMTFAWTGDHRALIESLPEESFEVSVPLLGGPAQLKASQSADFVAYLSAPSKDEALWKTLDAREPVGTVRAMSSLVENAPGDAAILRGVGLKAMALGHPEQAYHLFWRASAIQPFVPQGYLAMAQCLDHLGQTDLAMAWYEAINAATWNNRFGAIQKIARVEYVRLLTRIETGLVRSAVPEKATLRLAALNRDLGIKPGGLVITSQWNTDGTDVHVHIGEPSGEEAMWSHNHTKSGGALTQDVTQGYGPEMYTSNEPPEGTWKLRYDYYWSDRNRVSTRTMILLTAYEGWATKGERVSRRFVVMDLDRQNKDAGTLRIGH